MKQAGAPDVRLRGAGNWVRDEAGRCSRCETERCRELGQGWKQAGAPDVRLRGAGNWGRDGSRQVLQM